jgi:hypothetical protein
MGAEPSAPSCGEYPGPGLPHRPPNGRVGSKAAVVRHRQSIARPSHRACAVSQRLCVGHLLPSQPMCARKDVLLRVESFVIARRYNSISISQYFGMATN